MTTTRPLTHRCRAVGAAAIVLGAVLFGPSGSAMRSPESAGSAGSGVVQIGPANRHDAVSFLVELRPPHPTAFATLDREVSDPASTNYRHFLTEAEIGDRFGSSTRDVARVVTWLRRGGLGSVTALPANSAISVTGTPGPVGRLLGMSLMDYRDERTGLRFHRPSRAPHAPAELSGVISGFVGLDNRLTAIPAAAGDVGNPAGCGVCITPAQSAVAFDMTALHTAGFNGENQTVAIIMDGALKRSDITTWAAQVGLTGVKKVQITKTPKFAPGKDEQPGTDAGDKGIGEGTLDVEQVLGAAPHAQVVYYETTGRPGGFSAAVDAIRKAGKAKIITFSAGWCDLPGSDDGFDAMRAADAGALARAKMAGINVFVASGDAGAFTCNQSTAVPQWKLSTSWPADSPDVISVGGTFLDRSATGQYIKESAWGQPANGLGSGGGLNPIDTQPPWQTGPGVSNGFSNGRRQIPDVAGPSDPETGWYEYAAGKVGVTGGTSAASPLWAGVTALIQQYAASNGVASLGFLPPTLYGIAASNPPGSVFHDVMTGNNLHYPATGGWDFATGLGSPDVQALANAVVATLHPQQ